MKFQFVLWSALVMPLTAGTVTVTAASSFLPLSSGMDFCSQSVPGVTSCDISAIFSDPTGRSTGRVFASAAADYGSLSGDISIEINRGLGGFSGSYQSSFGSDITVLGGTGDGTLITHYHLISFYDWGGAGTGLPLPPSYQFQQEGTLVNYTPALHFPSDNLEEDFDVTSQFTFGEPFLLSAGTSVAYVNEEGFMGGVDTGSSAQITGYTVLDSSGAVVADATVQPTSIPEPGTLWLGVAGGLLIVMNKHQVPREPGS
jgi:hypothetical protein